MTGDATAYSLVTALERTHGQALLGFVLRLGLEVDVAQDVVQEALLRAYDALERGTPIDDIRAWVFTVTYRLAMDEHRRRRTASRSRGVLSATTPATAGDPVGHSERALVWEQVDRLPERQRAVLYLRYRADLPFESIGRVMGITSSAARSHATQALGTLRERMADETRR